MSSANNKAIIHLKRIKQLGETTLGKLTIEGKNKSWFVLEPAGPDSILEGSDKRIKAGTYKVLPYRSPKYPNVYELQNIKIAITNKLRNSICSKRSYSCLCLL